MVKLVVLYCCHSVTSDFIHASGCCCISGVWQKKKNDTASESIRRPPYICLSIAFLPIPMYSAYMPKSIWPPGLVTHVKPGYAPNIDNASAHRLICGRTVMKSNAVAIPYLRLLMGMSTTNALLLTTIAYTYTSPLHEWEVLYTYETTSELVSYFSLYRWHSEPK